MVLVLVIDLTQVVGLAKLLTAWPFLLHPMLSLRHHRAAIRQLKRLPITKPLTSGSIPLDFIKLFYFNDYPDQFFDVPSLCYVVGPVQQ